MVLVFYATNRADGEVWYETGCKQSRNRSRYHNRHSLDPLQRGYCIAAWVHDDDERGYAARERRWISLEYDFGRLCYRINGLDDLRGR